MENQLPEKGLRFAARDRAGVRRRRLSNFYRVARLRVMLGAEAQYRCSGCPTKCFPKGPALPHFRGRPDSRLELQRYGGPATGRIRTQKAYFWKICSRRNRKNAKIGILPPVMQQRQMEAIPPSKGTAFRAEPTPERKARDEEGRERLYLLGRRVSFPMREIGRLREIAFRGAGGGTRSWTSTPKIWPRTATS